MTFFFFLLFACLAVFVVVVASKLYLTLLLNNVEFINTISVRYEAFNLKALLNALL